MSEQTVGVLKFGINSKLLQELIHDYGWQADDRSFKTTKTKSWNRMIDMPEDIMQLAKN
ncbi:hypothetical protein [Leuconostoc gelidum]|uniref:hypothetical protein n=1 Tax=Leuconostoc gelidum TaxID=1244 RepID=UPI001CC3ECD3|nr:hypothetical protein [Leuconostoc gelidum]